MNNVAKNTSAPGEREAMPPPTNPAAPHINIEVPSESRISPVALAFDKGAFFIGVGAAVLVAICWTAQKYQVGLIREVYEKPLALSFMIAICPIALFLVAACDPMRISEPEDEPKIKDYIKAAAMLTPLYLALIILTQCAVMKVHWTNTTVLLTSAGPIALAVAIGAKLHLHKRNKLTFAAAGVAAILPIIFYWTQSRLLNWSNSLLCLAAGAAWALFAVGLKYWAQQKMSLSLVKMFAWMATVSALLAVPVLYLADGLNWERFKLVFDASSSYHVYLYTGLFGFIVLPAFCFAVGLANELVALIGIPLAIPLYYLFSHFWRDVPFELYKWIGLTLPIAAFSLAVVGTMKEEQEK